MSDKITETLLPETEFVFLLEDETERKFILKTFSAAKTLLVLSATAKLASSAGLDEVIGALKDATSFAVIVNSLPTVIENAYGQFCSLVGLLSLTNKEIKTLSKEGDIWGEAQRRGEEIIENNSLEQIANFLIIAVKLMGLETLVKQIAPLLKSLQ